MSRKIAFTLLFLAPAAAMAQTSPLPSAPPIQALNPNTAFLRVGTEVPLVLSEELSTKNKQLKTGQRFQMEVSAAVLVQGVVVIPVGSPAVGEITEARNKGMWGKSGKFSARVLYVIVNGRQIRLTGSFDQKGTAGGVGAVAVSAIVFAPAGFFMTGKSAVLPIGSPVKSFVDEDVPLAMEAQAPAPLQVAAPAPVLAPAATPALAPAATPAPAPAAGN